MRDLLESPDLRRTDVPYALNIRPGGVKRSAEESAIAGAVFITAGISLTSISFGAMSAPYYGAVFIALMLLFPIVAHTLGTGAVASGPFALLLLMPLTLWSVQGLFLREASRDFSGLPFALAMGVTIFLAVGIGSLGAAAFRRTMAVIAVPHILMCLYALRNYNFTSWRYHPDGFVSTAAWGEIALGAIVAAILSERRMLVLLSTAVGMTLIFATQMRGAGIAATLAVAVYLWIGATRRTREFLLLITLAAGMCVIIYPGPFQAGHDLLVQILMLDNRHRGVDAGLSGRMDNIAEAWQLFLQSPLIGVGSTNEVASYAHNGVVKCLAEYGVFYAALLLATFLPAIGTAIRLRYAAVLAALIAYIAFIMTAPRYVNFQVMPFLGLVATAFALITLERSRRMMAPARRLRSAAGAPLQREAPPTSIRADVHPPDAVDCRPTRSKAALSEDRS